jgi:DNA-binding NarL/FixJ family response regulator
LVVDDHPIVRKGLSNCLARNKHFVVIGEAEDGMAALAKVRELSPHLVLMDLDMPKLNGLSSTEILRRENPHIKIVILSVHNPAHYAVQILKSGAHGCVSKDASTAELVQAIETVAGGGDYFSADVAQSVLRKLTGHAESKDHQRISIREREVLVAITEGLSLVIKRSPLGWRSVSGP